MLMMTCFELNIGLLLIFVQADDRIVGGKSISIEEVPYTLSLRKNEAHICGAVLVAEDIALSVAHCFDEQGSYSIRAGSKKLNDGGEVVYVKQAILHPGHNKTNGANDLAILKFYDKVNLSNKIKPIKLPKPGVTAELQPGEMGTISGWGSKSSGSPFASTQLNAVQVPVLPHNTCATDYQFIDFPATMFCAGLTTGGKDSCNGDSGGPFVVNNTLYGLVSFGIDCAKPNYPGAYTNVSAHRQYIKDNCGL